MEDYRCGQHHKTRSIGRLYTNQYTPKNTVIEITLNEMEFQSSKTADKFLSCVGKKYATSNQLSNLRRLNHLTESAE